MALTNCRAKQKGDSASHSFLLRGPEQRKNLAEDRQASARCPYRYEFLHLDGFAFVVTVTVFQPRIILAGMGMVMGHPIVHNGELSCL